MPDRFIAPQNLAKFWTDPGLFGTVLLVMYLDTYGPEALDWQPATIQMEIEQDQGIEIPAGNYERLLTAISIYTSNSFYQSTPDFARACVVLSGHSPTPDMMLLPDCADLAWGITEGMLILPTEDDNPFSQEIIGYIGHAVQSEGIINPPDILRLAVKDQHQLAQINFDYSDDEDLASGIWKSEQDKTDSINSLIQGRMLALIQQLGQLPLQVGNTKEVAQGLLAKLKLEAVPQPL